MFKLLKRKLPHEKLPELLGWQENDNVDIPGEGFGFFIYMGCDGSKLVFKSPNNLIL